MHPRGNHNRCRVAKCRYAYTHVTMGHKCGTCGAFGHGQLECGNDARIASLQRFLYDTVDVWCTAPGCAQRATHTTGAHHCAQCQMRADACTCTAASSSVRRVTCPLCRVDTDVDLDATTVFTGASCAVCFESAPCVVFQACHHAVVCRECANRL